VLLDVSVTVSLKSDGLQLEYTVSGDTAGLRIPAATPPGPADGLWQHTCLEAFVAAEGETAYREFNFAPSGQWAVYRFASERVQAPEGLEVDPPPSTQVCVSPRQFTLTALLPWPALPSHANGLCIALSAVIEETNGRLSYWALQHPCERPDFHHPAGRSLRLALPAN
jgi:hypothetical protein